MATLTTSYQLIASGGTQSFNGAYGHLELYMKYNSQSTENNQTNYSALVNLVVTGGYIGNFSSANLSVSGDGISYSTDLGSDKYYSRTLYEGSPTVTHNDDGSKYVSVSASIYFASWQQTLYVSGGASLPTIPRASTPTCDSYFSIGNTLTINTNPLSSAYHYKLTYKTDFQTAETTITDSTAASSVTLDTSSLEDTWLKAIPNSPNTMLTIYEYTYNSSGTQVGSTKSCTTNAIVKGDSGHYAPTQVVTITTSTSSLTNDNTSIINGQTNINFNVVGTTYGYATISDYKFQKYTSDTSAEQITNTTGTYSVENASSSYIKYSAQTWDSRWYNVRQYYKVGTYFTLVPYSSVTLQGTLARTEPTSNEVKLTANGYYKSGTFGSTTGASSNSVTITWKYRIAGADTWTDGGTIPESSLTLDADNMKWSITSYSLGTIFSYLNNYEIQFTIADKLTSATTTMNVTKGIPMLGMFEDHIEANGEVLVYWD